MPIVRRIVNAVETSTTTITYVPIKLKTESDSTRHTTSINTSVPTTDRSINGALNTDEKCFITRDTSQDSPISVGKSISVSIFYVDVRYSIFNCSESVVFVVYSYTIEIVYDNLSQKA